MADLRELLTTILKTQRFQAQTIRDIGAQVHAIYDYIEEHDKQFAQKFSNLEALAQGDVALQLGNALMIGDIEKLIHELEGGETLNL